MASEASEAASSAAAVYRCTMKCKCKTFSKTALYILLKHLFCIVSQVLARGKTLRECSTGMTSCLQPRVPGVHFLPCATPDGCSDNIFQYIKYYTQPNAHIHLPLLLATLSSCLCCKLSKITWVMLVHGPHT